MSVIIFDTNVVSELIRPEPEPKVLAWFDALDGIGAYTTSITEAELRYGTAIMPVGKRRDALNDSIETMLTIDFGGFILPFNSAAAKSFATIMSMRRASGRTISHSDCQIAAICHSWNAVLATRNEKDFDGCGIRLINPWL